MESEEEQDPIDVQQLKELEREEDNRARSQQGEGDDAEGSQEGEEKVADIKIFRNVQERQTV